MLVEWAGSWCTQT